MIKYVHVPGLKSVFKAQEDCCFTQVVYDGQIGIKSKNDKIYDQLNSWDLLCLKCDQNMEMFEISEMDFQNCYNLVNTKQGKQKN